MNGTAQDQSALLKKAFLAIQDLEARLRKAERAAAEPIAIIGVGCRFPGGADGPQRFWELLRNGRNAVSLVPPERWDAEAWFDPDPDRPGTMVTRHGAFLKSVEGFDAGFFEIAPREAAAMDPQQRLALEVAWETLENAGCAPAGLRRTKTGVFLGIAGNDFSQLMGQAGDPELFTAHYASGAAHSIAAGRISYVLGLQGPAISLDTACSSSLVAVHLACQSLRAGDCNLALAGGVNLMLAPETSVLLSRVRMLSPRGQCRTFDESADGFVRGEGCGFVALKRLSQAQADGDRILAVIRGSAVNQDGASSSLTAPNGPAQEALMRDALGQAGVSAENVSYVEAHGTGTALGDPIELQGLGAVYGAAQPEHRPLMVGSLKTNMGHLEAAAGIASLIKVVLALEHAQIPPHLHLRQPTSRVNWKALRLSVPQGLTEWDAQEQSRMAGVSSFGFSGTNAHILLEESLPQESAARKEVWPVQVLAVSARTPAALGRTVAIYRDHLEQHLQHNLEDVCFTANAGRSHFVCRATFAAGDVASMVRELAAYSGPARPRDREAGRVGFLFTGQGSQYAGMGRELYEGSEVFREAVERCSAEWKQQRGESLTEALYERGDELKDARVVQPALFAVEYGLAEMWRSWGMEPGVVLGHSLGEYVAAVAAGLLKLEDGLRLVGARAELMEKLTERGAMRAVAADAERVRGAMRGWESEVAIAAINGPESVVISGGVEGVRAVAEKLEGEGVRTRELEVTHGFHSPLLEPILEEFEERARGVEYGEPRVRMVSNLTGRAAGREEMGRAKYWREHMRHTVQFHAGLEAALAAGCTTFIEIGPQPHLLSQAKATASDANILWLPSMRRGRNAWLDLLSAVRALYEDGAEIDWNAVHERRGKKIALPGYPWERQVFPVPRPAAAAPSVAVAETLHHPLLGTRVASPLAEMQFQSVIHRNSPAWLADHALHGQPLVPAAAYLEMALSAARIAGMGEAGIGSAAVLQPCYFHEPRILQCVLQRGEGAAGFAIYSASAAEPGDWLLHATGELTTSAGDDSEESLATARRGCSRVLPVGEFYSDFEQRGLAFGPGFRPLTAILTGDGEAVAEFAVPATAQSEGDAFAVHPVALDACLQTVAAAAMGVESDTGTVALPAGLESLRVTGDCRGLAAAHARVQRGSDGLRAEFHGFDRQGKLLLVGKGLIFRSPKEPDLARAVAESDLFYELDWTPLAEDAGSQEFRGGDRWLIVSGSADATSLAELLAERGAASALVGSAVEIAAAAGDAGEPWSDIVFLAPPSEAKSAWGPLKECFDAARVVAGHDRTAPARFWVVTHGAQGPGSRNAEQAALWGLARSMAIENAETRVIRIDMEAAPPAGNDWRRAISAARDEDEIAIRDAQVLTPRMRRKALPDKAQSGTNDAPMELIVAQRGTLEGLQWVPAQAQAPAEGEVEIAVRAAGLNFRDVLNALGMYKGKPGPLGGECAGVVTRAGAGVSGFAPGDEVVAVGPGSLRQLFLANAQLVWKKPERLSFAAAASLPIAFLTARYALEEVARIQPGESVLIHAGAGGVGLAAIQVACAAGAVVFATAGSEEKRAYLRAMGVSRAMHSRSTEFADEVREATAGRGVDVVLNSLTGPLIDAGFAALAPRGRFLELGVADLRSPEWVQSMRPDVSYFPIDLFDRNAIAARILAGVMEQLRAGELQPLPHVIFEMEKAQDAFRWMAQAKHIGKIVLSPRRQASAAIRRDGAYLVTGGFSGLGLEVAKWLGEQGAGEIVATGRRAPSQQAAEIFEAIGRNGSAVRLCQGDISQEADAAASIETMLPLRGVFHCAGMLDDAALPRQDWNRFERVLAGKAEGARHLDRLTRNFPLDHFVLFSSVAGVLGSAGQSNYAAANAFLDGLARQRAADNRPALSVDWGAWRETGMAVRHGVLERSAQTGMTGMPTGQALSALRRLMDANGGPEVLVLAMNWNTYLENPLPAWQKRLLGELQARDGSRPAGGENRRAAHEPWIEKLQAAGKMRQRDVLLRLLEERIRTTLGLPREQGIDAEQPLQELGLDSLLSIELRNSMGVSLRRTLPATLLFNYPTLSSLAGYLLSVTGLQESARPEAPRAKPGRRSVLENVEALSDEEVERMLNERAGRQKAGQGAL